MADVFKFVAPCPREKCTYWSTDRDPKIFGVAAGCNITDCIRNVAWLDRWSDKFNPVFAPKEAPEFKDPLE